MRLKISIIGLAFIFFFTFLTSPALASNEPWKTPPIPQGWRHVEGTWDTGYVIKDAHDNEFVWVPVGAINKNAEGKAELKAFNWHPKGEYGGNYNIEAPEGVVYSEATYLGGGSENYSVYISEVIANTGGFYIARYPASPYTITISGINIVIPRHKKDEPLWTNVRHQDAEFGLFFIKNSYDWEREIAPHLPYDRQWDVVVKWQEMTGSSNNIYGVGDMWEWGDDRSLLSRDNFPNNNLIKRKGTFRHLADFNELSKNITCRTAFVVLNSAPSVALINPAQGADITKGSPVNLTWSATDPDFGDRITDYNLRIGTFVGDNSLGTYSGANTSYSFNTSNILGPYPKTIYWAVRAKDDKNTWSEWKEGTFKITASNVATLSNITISEEGNLTPIFNSNTLNYSASVPFTTTSINITPTVTEPNATIKVNGNIKNSGESVPINLSVGNNEVKVVVTAQDGTTTKTYTITINRAANAIPVITLNSLKDKYSEVSGHNQVVVSGIVTDDDNDDVTVYLQVKKGETLVGNENKVLQKCENGKEFSFELNIDNQLDEGKYTIEIWADDGK